MNKKVDILKSKNYNEFLKTQLKLNKNLDTQVLEFIYKNQARKPTVLTVG